jgi:hypothetical protein
MCNFEFAVSWIRGYVPNFSAIMVHDASNNFFESVYVPLNFVISACIFPPRFFFACRKWLPGQLHLLETLSDRKRIDIMPFQHE